MKKISIMVVNIGAGNIYNIKNAVEYCGGTVKTSADAYELRKAEKIILPGVGAFPSAMKFLRKTKNIQTIQEHVKNQKPLLGICLGMQLLFEKGFEFGEIKGLCLIPGLIIKIPNINQKNKKLKSPHCGWNEVQICNSSQNKNKILQGVKNKENFYFLHSYFAKISDKKTCIAHTDYEGIKIPAIINKNNIWGLQFHPEKSGQPGLDIINNFLKL